MASNYEYDSSDEEVYSGSESVASFVSINNRELEEQGPRPYRFEPPRRLRNVDNIEENMDDGDGENTERLENTDW